MKRLPKLTHISEPEFAAGLGQPSKVSKLTLRAGIHEMREKEYLKKLSQAYCSLSDKLGELTAGTKTITFHKFVAFYNFFKMIECGRELLPEANEIKLRNQAAHAAGQDARPALRHFTAGERVAMLYELVGDEVFLLSEVFSTHIFLQLTGPKFNHLFKLLSHSNLKDILVKHGFNAKVPDGLLQVVHDDSDTDSASDIDSDSDSDSASASESSDNELD